LVNLLVNLFTVPFHCPISLSYGLSHLLTLYKIQIWVFFWFPTHVLKPPVLLWCQYIQLVLQPNIYCYLFNNIYFSHRLYSRYISFLFNYIIPSSWLYIERKSYWIYSTNSYIYSLSYFTVLFRRPISLSYFAVLFRCPISATYFAVLFRRPISATYFAGASSCDKFAYHIS
jgi:hypothetical protein